MPTNSTKFVNLFFGLLFFLLQSPSITAQIFENPQHKLVVALPTVNYTRETFLKSDGGTSVLGVAGEYQLFLLPSLSLFGQFELNLTPSNEGVAFLGGAGGLTWYIFGGGNEEHDDNYISYTSKPNFNLFMAGGLASKTFDFQEIDKAELEDGKVVDPDKKDIKTGSVIGILFSLGAEYPVLFNLLPGMRVQYIKSFSNDTTPDLSFVEIWLSVGFLL